jgi:hypothetical protein
MTCRLKGQSALSEKTFHSPPSFINSTAIGSKASCPRVALYFPTVQYVYHRDTSNLILLLGEVLSLQWCVVRNLFASVHSAPINQEPDRDFLSRRPHRGITPLH